MRFHAFHIGMLACVLALVAACAGCSGGSSSTTVISNAPPSVGAPASFIAVSVGTSVALSWSPVSGVDSYRIYRATMSPVSRTTGALIISGLPAATTVYSDTTVTTGSTYYYIMTTMRGAVESAESPEVSATPGASAGTIQGAILYEDKEYGSGGFTGSTRWIPVRHAEIDIVAVGNSTVLYTGITDSRGKYRISITPNATVVKVSVKSSATPSGSGTISTRSLSGALYAVPSDHFSLASPASVSIGIAATNLAGGAFNILDVMTTGFEFVKAHDGSYPTDPLNTFWQSGNEAGTYFCINGGCPVGDGIYVLGIASDTDQFDDDVLWHEFGHFVAYTYSLDESQGGVHYLGDTTQDLRLSWSEGWGDFFPGAVKTWLSTSGQGNLISSAAGVPLTAYVDTMGGGGFSVDFGNPGYNSSYASNEVAVAKLLTDLNDSLSMQRIWGVIRHIGRNPPVSERVNLELFWDRWLVEHGAADLSTMSAIYSSRSITYAIDGYEGDDTLVSARTCTPGAPQEHTLYAEADEDYMVFTAASTSYSISTDNLKNGADTILTLYGPSGTPITSNDNDVFSGPLPPNNATALSSRIQYSSFAIGQTYYLSVKSSISRPDSAGKYGSYTLTISP